MSYVLRPLPSLVSRLATSRHAVWLPASVAALAFVAFVLAFFYELLSYQDMVVGWANGDINSRAHLAASNLAEPLRTQDFRTIQQIGDACEADGVHLLITAERGGVVYDSRPKGTEGRLFYSARYPSGGFRVSVGMSQERVQAPFRKAIRGFCLAGLVGVAGVLLFFFVTYRQRVRIRELARVERFRREFIADVSHEIKTPLTGILGAAEMLGEAVKAKGEGEPSGRLVSLIAKESKRLNGLVQSILDLSRLEREGVPLQLVETDLTELVRDVAARHSIACTVGAAAAPRLRVSVDPQLVEQALANLVENAKRHSGSSEIAVSLAVQGQEIRIAVEDHGVGIPPEHAARIFERFHRVDPARAAETGGAGLGLAIVRRIARLHGGDVTYRPARPRGSVFTLTLKAG